MAKSTNLNNISKEAKKRINLFLESLDKKHDPLYSAYYDEEEAVLEFLADNYFNKSPDDSLRDYSSMIFPGMDPKKDLKDTLENKKNEKEFRKNISILLREFRKEARNGYTYLPQPKQEKILRKRIESLSYLFGNGDIYFSRKKSDAEEYIPLRKDITRAIIRLYKPKGLLDIQKKPMAISLD
ncbi:MAG: hypothetical protein ACP5OG_00495 [Candidatus Nanoarchaeia archaeon]